MVSNKAASLYPFCLLFCLQAIVAQEAAPLFSGLDMRTGQSIDFEDYRGKVIFLDFWASWCPPCIVSLPAYEQMRREINTDQFVLLAINVDEDPQDGMSFLEDLDVSYPVIADPDGDIGIPYGVRSLPVSYLINKDGLIVERYRGFEPGMEESVKSDILDLLGDF